MENKIEYRRATIADLQSLVELRIEFLLGFFPDEPGQNVEGLKKEMVPYLSQTIGDGNYVCYLAYSGNRAVGCGGIAFRQRPGNFFNFSGRDGYIMSMYTVPDMRKKGVCTAILNLLLDAARENGVRQIELHASSEGEPVYIRNGFKLHGEPTYRKNLE
jgi:GNAT superfamily N-acetyltransferase